MHPSMQHLARMRAKDKQREQERRTGLRPEVAAPYGSSSSYTPATDACSAPFVPAADVYSPPPSSPGPAPSCEGGGGSFDGGGASGD